MLVVWGQAQLLTAVSSQKYNGGVGWGEWGYVCFMYVFATVYEYLSVYVVFKGGGGL